MTTDMSSVIIAKSDQLNSDDLISGPITITVTGVRITPGTEQPVAISYEGDNDKPYKSCKSMARVLVQCWGPDASRYTGRSMTLYRDPNVTWGGMAVGGIRISHMSHIDGTKKMALTATKGSKKLFVVQPLEKNEPEAADKAAAGVSALIDRIKAAENADALDAITGDEAVIKQRVWLRSKRPELADRVDAAVNAAMTPFLTAAPDADVPGHSDFPGDQP